MSESAIAMMEQFSAEAHRICDERGDRTLDALRSVENRLNYCRYLEAVRPYLDTKCRVISLYLAMPRMLMNEDGTFTIEPSGVIELPPDARAALATIDEAINAIADRYMRRRPCAETSRETPQVSGKAP